MTGRLIAIAGALIVWAAVGAAPAGAAVLWDQNSGGDNSGTPSFDDTASTAYTETADDFVVPAGQIWTVDHIEVNGVYDPSAVGPNAITSINVRFYTSSGSLPSVETGAGNLALTPSNGLLGPDFSVALASPVSLSGGGAGASYWFAPQVNEVHSISKWEWENRSTFPGTNPAAARSTVAAGCPAPTWIVRTTVGCGLDVTVPDQKFSLSGTITPISSTIPFSGSTKKCKKKKKKHHSAAAAKKHKKKKCRKKKRKK